MTDWYKNALEEFMFDGPLFLRVDPEIFKRVYVYLKGEGLIDYDVEKEFLLITYADPDDDEGCLEDDNT